MPRVKLLYHTDREINWEEAYSFVADSTDWVDVTDEELGLLRGHLHAASNPSKYRVSLVIERNDLVPEVIKSGRAFVEKAKRDEAERLQKQQERKKRAKESKLRRKREQLAKLKQELGEP